MTMRVEDVEVKATVRGQLCKTEDVKLANGTEH
jgi:hypothetical protein